MHVGKHADKGLFYVCLAKHKSYNHTRYKVVPDAYIQALCRLCIIALGRSHFIKRGYESNNNTIKNSISAGTIKTLNYSNVQLIWPYLSFYFTVCLYHTSVLHLALQY